MKNITVFIAEDSPNVRENLKRIIMQTGGLKIIGEAATVKSSIEFSMKEHPDIFLIDIGLEDGSGIELLKFVKSQSTPTKTIVFTNYISSPYEIICRKLGADHFLDKTKDLDRLIDILQQMPAPVE